MFSSVLERLKGSDGTYAQRTQGPAEPVSGPGAPMPLARQGSPTTVEVNQSNDPTIDDTIPDHWLDPFLPLENCEWYEQNSAWLGYLDPQMAAWPNVN